MEARRDRRPGNRRKAGGTGSDLERGCARGLQRHGQRPESADERELGIGQWSAGVRLAERAYQ